ncbi:large-conductance mechanosensitive channel protein MscL [Weissella koreensis]|uniref:Large-conductance mechanosensitive channel n=1 Tax=Weissella koreensis TaxID=165096 RepID=A0A7H1MMU0_9LACO|nr:large-conductance mechanosensitive channel protein MscL [Weissella koreensis]AEJ23956.1 large conductance mechanosensitive channel protein [Weissella koreensis KACC 15510]AVH75573.1 large-conductance mechanosensitive channel protein MscL [Weissella koreensis]MCZ9311627.1 large-conductance mechanosensitive channel protein MscL [Weissella koreensis]QGN20794.1 large-conductance mechanosensitive channel protein MscL [Weissella koreensis]QNT64776.1 large-conductance mechanosensitive channel prot
MLKEFKEFISRGSVLDLAVGVIIGGAFTGLVKSLTNNLINPIIGLFTGQVSSLDNLKLTITDNLVLKYGAFLGDVINFLITAFVVFLIIKFLNKALRRDKSKDEPEVVNPEVEMLAEIRDLLADQKK